jgi:rhamnosyltransferase
MNNKNYRIDGLTVLYNPNKSVLKNIDSYIDDIDLLYVVDNSPVQNFDIVSQIKKKSKVIYFFNNNRGGIAAALNIGAKTAIKNNANWLLTMDQDSSFKGNDFIKFCSYLSLINYDEISIISPFHCIFSDSLPSSNQPTEVKVVMTSGNLLNIDIYKKIGDFRESFFIDYVDYDYCLRSLKKGFKIIRYNDILLNHQLGNSKLYFSKILVTNHSTYRRYFITRNRLFLIKEHFTSNFTLSMQLIKHTITDFIKILFFESEKLKKVSAVFKGYKDFILNKL